MAKVKGALLGREARGSIGGVVTFQKWKTLNIVKKKGIPRNPQTAAQISERTKYGECVQAYRDYGLSEEDIAAWDRFRKYFKQNGSYYNSYIKTCIGVKVEGNGWNPLHNMEYLYINAETARVTLYGPPVAYSNLWVGLSPREMVNVGGFDYETDHFYKQKNCWVLGEYNYWALESNGVFQSGIYRQKHAP